MDNEEKIESLDAVVVELIRVQVGLADLEGKVDFNLLMSIRREIAGALKKIADMQIDLFWPEGVVPMIRPYNQRSN